MHHATAKPVAGHSRLQHSIFEFTRAAVEDRTVTLRYRLTGGAERPVDFEERLRLPSQIPVPDPEDPIVSVLLDGIHRAFGVSYFKAAIPPEMSAKAVLPEDASFWDSLYNEGLGEFYYVNRIRDPCRMRFPRGSGSGPSRSSDRAKPGTKGKVLILLGGGKDSLVAREIVRTSGLEADAFSLGTSYWIERSAKAAGLRHLVATRQMDETLFELNKAGAYNGHVPISACIALLSLLVAHLGDYESVIAANEGSANEGNLIWNGMVVNHQWSKGLDFESTLRAWCARHLPCGPTYFSLLRPLSEIRIAQSFARHHEYFDSFASCNVNFKIHPAQNPNRWCGICPKCLFVQMILAPFLGKDAMTAIFGGDFLERDENRAIVEQMAGVSGHKPLDCVGTTRECRAALSRLACSGRMGPRLQHWYEQRLAPILADAEALWEESSVFSTKHLLPPFWENVLHDYLRDAPQ